MAGDVSVWVPIAVAGLGFVGVLGSQLIGAWREDRRWGLDSKRREDDRRYLARQESYAQILGAMEHWDVILYPVWKIKASGGAVGADAAEKLRAVADSATSTLGLVVLVAPEKIRKSITDVIMGRVRFTENLLSEHVDESRFESDWQLCQDKYRRLRASMRVDLGFDGETSYLEDASPLC